MERGGSFGVVVCRFGWGCRMMTGGLLWRFVDGLGWWYGRRRVGLLRRRGTGGQNRDEMFVVSTTVAD